MRDFLHRFYPYQALKLLLQRVKGVRQRDALSTTFPTDLKVAFDPIQARSQLVALFRALKQASPSSASPTNALLSGVDSQGQGLVYASRRFILYQQLGFNLKIAPSRIPNAGLGVFLCGNEKNSFAKSGSIVAMYPGTLYRPGEAIFFNSINNRYILKCNDGVYVDGKVKGLSGSVFRSANGRDNYPGITPTADATWMIDWTKKVEKDIEESASKEVRGTAISSTKGTTITKAGDGAVGSYIIKNPLAVGQIINNGTTQFPPNVRYQELDIRTRDCPLELQEFLPNIWYSDDWHAHDHDHDEVDTVGEETAADWSNRSQSDLDHLRTVVLVTTREVKEGEELYSTYIEQNN
ncbi:SET domain-containing protein 9 [Entomortierella chlamydospora]|nr:SET domain-containing protein 9 [Entomortierella chlamydospora]